MKLKFLLWTAISSSYANINSSLPVSGKEFSYQLFAPLTAAQRFSSVLFDFFDEQLVIKVKQRDGI